MKSIRFLLQNLDSYRLLFFTLLLSGVIDGIAGFSVPILLSEFLSGELNTQAIRTVLPLIAGCLVVSLMVQWCLRRWGESLTIWIANNLQIKLFKRAEQLTFEQLAENHSGYLLSLISQVTGNVGGLSSTLVWLIGHVSATLPLFFYLTARESVTMALVNGAILIVFILISVILSRRIVPLADQRNRASAHLSARFVDFMANIITVKKLGIMPAVLSRLEVEKQASDNANFKFQIFHANRWGLLHLIFYTSIFLTIAVLLHQIEAGVASAPVLILFVAGFSRVQNYAERLSELVKFLIETDVYVEKLEYILSRSQNVGERQVTEPFKSLRLEGVVHGYGNSRARIVIPELEVRSGERLLITGQSGQGKSTLLAILANQITPREGKRSWNGLPYDEFDPSLSRQFALVSQECELFNLTLRENLSMGVPLPESELIAMLNDLHLKEFLGNLTEGLDTLVGEKGLRLSAGQKQRINLARAILLKRPILLLDEPTSHLDTYTEEIVVSYLNGLSRDITQITVSHRTPLRRIADRACAFIDGTLVPSRE